MFQITYGYMRFLEKKIKQKPILFLLLVNFYVFMVILHLINFLDGMTSSDYITEFFYRIAMLLRISLSPIFFVYLFISYYKNLKQIDNENYKKVTINIGPEDFNGFFNLFKYITTLFYETASNNSKTSKALAFVTFVGSFGHSRGNVLKYRGQLLKKHPVIEYCNNISAYPEEAKDKIKPTDLPTIEKAERFIYSVNNHPNGLQTYIESKINRSGDFLNTEELRNLKQELNDIIKRYIISKQTTSMHEKNALKIIEFCKQVGIDCSNIDQLDECFEKLTDHYRELALSNRSMSQTQEFFQDTAGSPAAASMSSPRSGKEKQPETESSIQVEPTPETESTNLMASSSSIVPKSSNTTGSSSTAFSCYEKSINIDFFTTQYWLQIKKFVLVFFQ